MEYNIKPSENRDYIILTVVGDFTVNTFMTCLLESHLLGQEMGIHNYLVDVTKAKNIETCAGIYNFAHSDMKVTQGVDSFARVAGLVSPGDHSHDFVETTSYNAGLSLKLFTDDRHAIGYLLKRKPPA